MVPGDCSTGSLTAVERNEFHGLHIAREESRRAGGVVARHTGGKTGRSDVPQFTGSNRIVTLHGQLREAVGGGGFHHVGVLHVPGK